MYHELYGLKKEEAEKVVEYVLEMYLQGRSITETILCSHNDVRFKRFCAFMCGVVSGVETRETEQKIYEVLEAIKMLKHKELIQGLAYDICAVAGCDISAIIDVLEDYANGELDIIALIDNEWSIWKHFMYGFFVGLYECYDENFNISVVANSVKVKYSNVMEKKMKDLL